MQQKNKQPFRYYIARDASWLTASNIVTAIRIILAPFVMIGIANQLWGLTFLILVAASLSDLLDGYMARLFKQHTALGTILDPIADKFFILCCFYALVFLDSPSFQIPVWFFVMECIRELTILGGSYFLIRTNMQFQVCPTNLGKLTTFFQLVFISWLFICRFFQWNPVKTFVVFLIFLTLFSVCSLLHYVAVGWVYFTESGCKKG